MHTCSKLIPNGNMFLGQKIVARPTLTINIICDPTRCNPQKRRRFAIEESRKLERGAKMLLCITKICFNNLKNLVFHEIMISF
ncbi:AAEL001443-PA [Aedes aegypti]|uniref:AAEL001443-PA n=1 Tax=Aedes aegypti TaxID=7159 RepID=Q17L71_AEDAE|nr:AAEL001443-PA [Aedes aegypti]